MKTFKLICLLTLSLFSIMYSQVDSEKEAIKKVLNEFYQALIERDWDKYLDTWAHEPTAVRISVDDNKTREILGWEKIEKYYKRWAAFSPNPDNTEFEYKNFDIVVHQDEAWASFDNHEKDDKKRKIRELRRLVKRDGNWKILTLIVITQEETE